MSLWTTMESQTNWINIKIDRLSKFFLNCHWHCIVKQLLISCNTKYRLIIIIITEELSQMGRYTSPIGALKRHLSFKRLPTRTLNDCRLPKLLKKPKQPSWATEMAINLGETIFKSSYSKLALLYPWRPGNVNVFSLWTDGRNACCLKFLHQRSRTHPPLV